jgi:uridine kinase
MHGKAESLRQETMAAIADAVLSASVPHPLRVAIDGPTASGKTTFAAELAHAVRPSGREILCASIDGFHRCAAARYHRGRFSSDGYYEDARDFDAVRTLLLDPLGPNGDLLFATENFSLEHDEPIRPQMLHASADAILIVDGTFLQRPELRSAWDLVIFLNVSTEEARRRGVARDAAHLGTKQAAALYDRRYGPAFARYRSECQPDEQADIVVDNEGVHTRLVRGRVISHPRPHSRRGSARRP